MEARKLLRLYGSDNRGQKTCRVNPKLGLGMSTLDERHASKPPDLAAFCCLLHLY